MKAILKESNEGKEISCKILTHDILRGGEGYTHDDKICVRLQDPSHLIEDLIKAHGYSWRFDFIIDDQEHTMRHENLKIIEFQCLSIDLSLYEIIIANGIGV